MNVVYYYAYFLTNSKQNNIINKLKQSISMKSFFRMVLAVTILAMPLNANASDMYAKVTAKVAKTENGKGLIYVQAQDKNASSVISATTYNEAYYGTPKEEMTVTGTFFGSLSGSFTLLAIPEEGYAFDYWENVTNETTSITNSYTISVPTSSKLEEAPEYEIKAYFDKADCSADMYMSTAGIATFCSPFATVMPKGYKAYDVESYDNESNTLKLVARAYADKNVNMLLPNFSPVIVFAQKEVKESGVIAKSYGLSKNTEKEFEKTNGYLFGVYEANQYIPKGCYVLQMVDGEPTFCKVETDNVPATQYRCYLKLPEDQSYESNIRIAFVDEEVETTSISVVESSEEASEKAVYSVNGEKLNDLQKGINIVKENGVTKKIMK